MGRKSRSILAMISFLFGGVLILLNNAFVPLRSNKVTHLAETGIDKVKTPISTEIKHPYIANIEDKIEPTREDSNITPKKGAQIEQINAIKKEMQGYVINDIIKEIANIKSEIYESDLIDRLNRDLLTEQERDDANGLFVRYALLGLEKAHRGLDRIKPELESALKKHKENMGSIKQLLEEEDKQSP